MNFNCGSCVIVISRKYAIILTIILIFIYFLIPSPTITVNPGGMQFILRKNSYLLLIGNELNDVSWEIYAADCGKQSLLNNGVRAKKNFETKYNKNIITWKGAIQSKIEKNRIRDPTIQEALLIKMNPTDSKVEFPDLELVVSPQTYNEYQQILDSLQSLDIIEFKASFRKMGDEFQYHAFNLVSINNTNEKFDWNTMKTLEIVPQSSNLRKKDALPSPQ